MSGIGKGQQSVLSMSRTDKNTHIHHIFGSFNHLRLAKYVLLKLTK